MVAVAVVKVCGRLVHDEHARILHQRPGDEHKLAFAAANLAAAALRQMRNAELIEHLHDERLLRCRRTLQRAELCRHTHENAFAHGVIEGRRIGLRNVGDFARKRAAGKIGKRFAVDSDLTALRLEKAEKTAKKRRFAHAVWTEQGDDLAAARGKADILQHRRAAVGKGKGANVNCHCAPPPTG